ncbi:MAG: YrrS family protein [Bacillus sp. (in: firmicutes)]
MLKRFYVLGLKEKIGVIEMDEKKPSRMTSRSEQIGKKRKVNRIYNILLSIVIIAILVVVVMIVKGNSEDEYIVSPEQNSAQQEEATKDEEKTPSDDTEDKENTSDGETEDEVDTEEETVETEGLEGASIVENSNDSNVAETYVNENWKSVGTTQTGEHTVDFTKGSVDWNEMEQALAYGAGLEVDNMTLYWLGNGGTNKAVGTISPKDKSATYRVYIEWVDGSGWKPYQVEKLKTNDKAR